MDSHTDYTVKLKTNTGKYYSWCIQEFDAGGKQVGTDLTPWDGVQDFRVSNLRYYFNLKNSSFYSLFNGDEWEEDDESEEEVEAADQNKDLKASEVILADLTPSGEGHKLESLKTVRLNRLASARTLSLSFNSCLSA